ncbi:hypothetical protein C0J52_14587, partial [Blattella germanica]
LLLPPLLLLLHNGNDNKCSNTVGYCNYLRRYVSLPVAYAVPMLCSMKSEHSFRLTAFN